MNLTKDTVSSISKKLNEGILSAMNEIYEEKKGKQEILQDWLKQIIVDNFV